MNSLELAPSTLILSMAALAVLPIALSMTTAYIKVSVVLGIFRSGLGLQQIPGKLVELALAISITAYIMIPVFSNLKPESLADISQGIHSQSDWRSLEGLFNPWRKFLLKATGSRELTFFVELRKAKLEPQKVTSDLEEHVNEHPDSEVQEVSDSDQSEPEVTWDVLLPAFVLSELSRGFVMGLSVLIPFLVVDLVVATILSGVGFTMVSPSIVSLPVKILLLVVTDGWLMLVRGLVLSY